HGHETLIARTTQRRRFGLVPPLCSGREPHSAVVIERGSTVDVTDSDDAIAGRRHVVHHLIAREVRRPDQVPGEFQVVGGCRRGGCRCRWRARGITAGSSITTTIAAT